MERAKVYIKVDEYKDVIEVVQLIRDKARRARAILEKINELRNQEDAELEAWRAALDDVEDKVSIIDKTLLEPEDV